MAWAKNEFGNVDLGDVRRTARLVAMAACASDQPSGKIAAVFTTDKEREGAYDFVENEHVSAAEMMAGVAEATARRAAALPFVVVPIDGTSLNLVDRADDTDFGRVGTHEFGARGVKVVDALGVDPDGVVLGWLGMTFWVRPPERRLPPAGTYARRARSLEERETSHWIKTIHAARDVLDARGLRAWFQIDREGDGRDMLLALAGTEHWWTVRSNRDRSIELEGGDQGKLRAELGREKPQGQYDLEVLARPKRRARTATMVIRTSRVVLRLRDQLTSRITLQEVVAVWAREEDTTPEGEEPLDWLLFTNYPVATLDDARLVLRGYSQRWRVEECHRTWKSGACDIEATHLRSFDAVCRWAIIIGAVASRIERLKRLARKNEDAPAAVELNPLEIRALTMLHFDGREGRPTTTPTIAEVVSWLAELGGYANKYSGRPPGATVIGRGLRRMCEAARVLEIVARAPK